MKSAHNNDIALLDPRAKMVKEYVDLDVSQEDSQLEEFRSVSSYADL